MAQRSYGSITIVDTNDIQRFYVQYAKNNSSATAPSSGWSQTRPEWQNGTYIWQRTVAKRQGVALTGSDYGTPVCITGEKGQQGIQGNTGKGISSIVTTYCNYAQGTPVSSYSGWSSSVPAYDSTKPNYWVKTVVNYTSGNPSTTIYKDLGITEATQKANLAVTTANTAEANSIQAIAIADGKNKIYYANTFNPASDSSVYNNGDTLFYKTNNGTVMYVYDSTYSDATSGHWRQQQFEENAIANLAITNAKINDLHGNKITANTIAGNKIIAHDITANQLATNAIQSNNYVAGTAPYSTAGTFLDLTQGNIYTPNFGVNNTAILENNQIKLNVGAYIKGSIYAYNGTIGSNTAGNNPNYWYIGDYQDYNQNNSALIKGYGTATIQLGNTSTWRLNTNRIHTAWYDDNDSTNSFRLHYLNFNSEYWDLGFHVPTSVSDKFIYIRKTSTENSLAVLQSAINDNANGTNTYWNYQFYVTNDGSLYAKNIYIKDTNGNDVPVGGSDGVYLLKSGGTITGNLQVNGNYLNKNGNALTLQTNLGSTTAGTLTGNTSSAISIGVTGTLPSSNGGTGNTNWNQGGVVYIDGSSPKKLLSTAAGTSSYLLQSNGTGAPTWINPATLTVAAATKATQDGDGNVIKTTYLKLSGGNVTGPVSFGDSVSIDDLNAGTLVVTGNASFVNNINVDSINGVQVGETPEFTDTVTTVSTTGTGNAITAISASNGAITATKGSTFLTGITSSQVITALGYTPYNATNPNGYTSKQGTVTSVRVQASSPLQSSTSTEQSVSLNTTISFTNQNANVVLAGPSSGNAAAPAFRALIAADIPTLTKSKISDFPTTWALSSVTGADDLKAIEALTGTSGLLKKTAANTWTLDTNTYLTGITSSQVTTALGFTPYNATNPNGYTNNTGTVTKVTAGSGLKIDTNTSGGDITTTGTINHINSVTAQTTQALYPIKIDAQGHISAYGSAVTSWALSSVTGADDLKAIEALSGTSGFLKKTAANTWSLDTTSYVSTTRKVNGHALSSDVSVTKSDVGLGQVANALQITDIGSQDGQLVLTFGDGTTSNRQVTISAYQQSSVTSAQKATGDQNGNRIYTSYAASLDWTLSTRTLLLKSKSGAQLSSVTIPDTTYTFDGTYNASSNKAATVSTVTNAINALDGNLNNTTPGAGKTLTAFSQTDGKVSATFGNISITKSQISDFPSTLTPTSHTHGNIQNGGTLQTNDITIGSGDKLIVTDYSDSNKIARTSISFDGSTATKALTQKGTWETFNNYSLPLAASGTRGGVQIGYSSSGKNYAVQLSSEKMYVNVPWTDTTYSAGTGLSLSGTTFSLADNYGDTKNPYASKTANYVLAAPDGNNGTPSFRNLVFRDIKPLQSKTYTSVVMTANNDPNGWVYFAKFVPTSITDLAYVKFRVRAEAAGTNYSYNDSFVEYWIRSSAVQGYTTYNKIKHTDYRAFYNHSLYRATDTGIQNEYGHLLGIRFTSSWNPATAANARTVIIDILEIENCTITFFDSMVKYVDAPGTGSTNYAGRSDYDGTTQGITMSGDRNDANCYNRNYYGCRTTSAALYRYQLCLTKLDRTLIPINSVNNSIATNKTLTTESFDPFGDILYWASTTTYNAGANVGDGWYSQYLADLRYSFNVGGYNTTSTLVGRKPLYLVCIPQDDGLAKLDTNPLIQALPTVEDGKLYIYLGQVYPDTYPYRVYLTLSHPVYIYQNGGIQLYKRNEKLSLKVKTDREPYLFRASGGEGADRVEECIVGGTVAWNQLQANTVSRSANGISFTFSDGTLTVDGEATGIAYWLTASHTKWDWYADHIYLVDVCNSEYSYSSTSPYFYIAASPSVLINKPRQIVKFTSSANTYLQFVVRDGNVVNNQKYKPQVFDLTAMFGSTIADYIYSLEQSTAGAGVAWFRKYFSEDYYEYSAPVLKHVEGVSAKQIRDADDNVTAIYPLDSTLTLRGIPKLTDGKMWFDGDKYLPSGQVERRYIEYTVTGQESVYGWYSAETSPYGGIAGGSLYIPTLNGIKISGYIKGIANGGYQVKYANEDKTIYTSVQGRLTFINSAYSTMEAWLAGITGVTVLLELENPTTEQADPYISPQKLDPYGTEEFVSTGMVPVGHYSEYPQIKINTTNIQNPYILATTSAYGFMSANDKVKLNNIATGAEVNQNAFSNIKIGSSTVAADTKTDTLELVAGNYISLTPDTTNDKITIGVKDVTTTLNTSANLPTANAVKSYVDNAISNLNISNYVTLNTAQTISGTKTFTGGISVKSSATTNACNINYNTSLNALVFSFA